MAVPPDSLAIRSWNLSRSYFQGPHLLAHDLLAAGGDFLLIATSPPDQRLRG